MPLSCYRFGPPQKSDPRATKEHAEAVKSALGLLDPNNKAYHHLRPDDKELREEDLLWCHGLYIHKKAENEALELASGKVD